MSTDFTAAQAALKTWFRLGSGLTQVIMENEARPLSAPQFGEMKIVSCAPEGGDVVRYDDDRKPFVRCVRVITLRLAVVSFSQTPSLFAPVALELLMARSLLPRLQEILKSVPLVVIGFTQTRNADPFIDERYYSRFETDARLRWTFDALAPADEPAVEVIDKVEGLGLLSPDDKQAPYEAERP